MEMVVGHSSKKSTGGKRRPHEPNFEPHGTASETKIGKLGRALPGSTCFLASIANLESYGSRQAMRSIDHWDFLGQDRANLRL